MTETKFTPGPWKTNGEIWRVGSAEWVIVTSSKAEVAYSMTHHDAHLIAAAPELFEKLAKIRGWINVDAEGPWGKRFYAEVDALLAKARGEA